MGSIIFMVLVLAMATLVTAVYMLYRESKVNYSKTRRKNAKKKR